MSNVITPVKTDERTKLGIRSGDTVRVHQRIVERGKTRIQTFEGLVIAVKHGHEAGGTFTVRATLSGVGVEKIFPLFAPFIEEIEIVRRSKVRRAKLYFIRDKVSREVRRQLRNMRMVNLSTTDFAEAEVPADEMMDEVADASDAVSVEEVQENDPAQAPTGEELSPEAENAGEPEGPVVDEAEPMPPAETPA